MTNEEAARIINNCKDKGFKYTFYTLNEYHMALDMAIKALEQQPCGDTISRADIKKIVKSYVNNLEESYQNGLEGASFAKHGAKTMGALILDLPSVSTEKTGRWEEVQFRTIPYNRISKAKKCSVCGKRKDKYVIWNYCPNCGAKMEVEE